MGKRAAGSRAKGRRKIRVGVFGVRRGTSFIGIAPSVGMELVAICDAWEEGLKRAGEQFHVATYTDYEKFLEHDMDAVVLANYFHEHAPFAIKALAAGKHVMSECAACGTLGEGVALARAVEKSGKIYMFAENVPYTNYNQEMRRLYAKGAIGEFLYGEGEYVHPDPPEVKMGRSPGYNHWRNWLPAPYYCTHSMAPVMYITDTRPVKVNGFAIPYDFDDPTLTMTVERRDTASVIMCRMDTGAVVKSIQWELRGPGLYTRIHGNRGLMENCRQGDKQRVRLWREPWEKPKGAPVEMVYTPDFPIHHDKALRTGHWGADFFTSFHFAEAIRKGEPPYLDVYRGIDMSIVGILAWRSILNDSVTVEVPDFRKESVRRKYARDDWTPDPARKRPGQPPSSILGEIKPTRKAIEFSRKVWRKGGYMGK